MARVCLAWRSAHDHGASLTQPGLPSQWHSSEALDGSFWLARHLTSNFTRIPLYSFTAGRTLNGPFWMHRNLCISANPQWTVLAVQPGNPLRATELRFLQFRIWMAFFVHLPILTASTVRGTTPRTPPRLLLAGVRSSCAVLGLRASGLGNSSNGVTVPLRPSGSRSPGLELVRTCLFGVQTRSF